MIKEFTDQDLIQRRYIADLGENGEFYAQKIVLDEIGGCFNRVKVEGTLCNYGGEKDADLILTLPAEFDIYSMTAGEIFNAAWDEYQIEIL